MIILKSIHKKSNFSFLLRTHLFQMHFYCSVKQSNIPVSHIKQNKYMCIDLSEYTHPFYFTLLTQKFMCNIIAFVA